MNSSALLQIIYLTNSFYAVWCWSLLKLVVVMVLVKAGRDLEKLNVELKSAGQAYNPTVLYTQCAHTAPGRDVAALTHKGTE